MSYVHPIALSVPGLSQTITLPESNNGGSSRMESRSLKTQESGKIGKSGRRRRSVQSRRSSRSENKADKKPDIKEKSRIAGCSVPKRISSSESLLAVEVPTNVHVSAVEISSPPKFLKDHVNTAESKLYRTQSQVMSSPYKQRSAPVVVPVAPINPLVRSPLRSDYVVGQHSTVAGELRSPSSSTSSSTSSSPRVSDSTPIKQKSLSKSVTKVDSSSERQSPSPRPLAKNTKNATMSIGSSSVDNVGNTEVILLASPLVRDGDVSSHGVRSLSKLDSCNKSLRKSTSISEDVQIINGDPRSPSSSDHTPVAAKEQKKNGCCSTSKDHSVSESSSEKPAAPAEAAVKEQKTGCCGGTRDQSYSSSSEDVDAEGHKKSHRRRHHRSHGCCGHKRDHSVSESTDEDIPEGHHHHHHKHHHKPHGCCGHNRDHSVSQSCSDESSDLKTAQGLPTIVLISAAAGAKDDSESSVFKSSKKQRPKRFRCGGFCGFCKEDSKRMSDYPESINRRRCNGKCCGYNSTVTRERSSSTVVPFVPSAGSAVALSMNKNTVATNETPLVESANFIQPKTTYSTTYMASPQPWTTTYQSSRYTASTTGGTTIRGYVGAPTTTYYKPSRITHYSSPTTPSSSSPYTRSSSVSQSPLAMTKQESTCIIRDGTQEYNQGQ